MALLCLLGQRVRLFGEKVEVSAHLQTSLAVSLTCWDFPCSSNRSANAYFIFSIASGGVVSL